MYYKITRTLGSQKHDLEFAYNPMGQRTLKIVKPVGTVAYPEKWEYTYYRRDANGNIMANYDIKYNADVDSLRMHATEFNLYGSSRLGIINNERYISRTSDVTPIPLPTMLSGGGMGYAGFVEDPGFTPLPPIDALTRIGITSIGQIKYEYGNLNFELSNHLGNVLSVVNDRKLPIGDGASTYPEVDYFNPDVISYNDYYAFGSTLPGRLGNSGQYRFGFNGMEKDDETYGDGNALDFGARIYDSRLGRWLSIDPLQSKYPNLSPYNFCAGNPLIYKDVDGKDYILIIDHVNKTITIKAVYYTQIGDMESYNSAVAGAQFWNEQSCKFIYSVRGDNNQTIDYDIIFDLSVQPVENPLVEFAKDRNIMDPNTDAFLGTRNYFTNTYSVLPDVDERFKQKTTEDGSIVDEGGKTLAGFRIYVKKSMKDNQKIAAHEIGHTLGLYHNNEGLMAAIANSEASGDYIQAYDVKGIVKPALKGKAFNGTVIEEQGNRPEKSHKGKVYDMSKKK